MLISEISDDRQSCKLLQDLFWNESGTRDVLLQENGKCLKEIV